MTKTEIVSVRIPPEIKRDAEKALAKLKLTPEEAIEDFYQQIALAYQAGGEDWLNLPRVTCCLCWGMISNSPGPVPRDDEEGADLHFASFEDWMAFHLAEEAMDLEDNGEEYS